MTKYKLQKIQEMYNNKILVNTFIEARNIVLKTERDELNMERKKKKKHAGVYLTICSCAVIIAMVGYAGRISMEEPQENNVVEVPEVTPEDTVSETSQKIEVEVPDSEGSLETEVVEKPEVIEFLAPVDGKVIEEYSGDDLVYNEALKDWRAHSGVDFEAKIGDSVKASAKGVVESVFDSNMGRCVTIDHKNGFVTMYANLEENTAVKEGDEVQAGDVIGTVGNTALGDITDLEHVHFEMMNAGENVNPVDHLQ